MEKILKDNINETKLAVIMEATSKMMKIQYGLPENALMTQADQSEAQDILNLFVKCSADPEYCVEGLQDLAYNISTLALAVSYTPEKESTYTLTIVGVRNLSLRTLSMLTNHGSVNEIVVEPCLTRDNSQKITISSLNISIVLFKYIVNKKTVHVWHQDNRLSPDENTTGLVMDEKSKATARLIICLVTNMAFRDWEPIWSNRVHKDSYMLEASHVRRVPFSFYTYLKSKVGSDILHNCIVMSEIVDGHPSMTLMFHCKSGAASDSGDADDDDAYEDVDEGESRRKGKHGHSLKKTENILHATANRSIRKNGPDKSKAPSEGLLRSLASFIGFK